MNYKGSLMAVALISMPLTAAPPPDVTASGTGGNTQTATENSWVAAHFACNRSGFWADLDTLQVTGTDKSSYTIAGGRKKINTYRVNVTATCGTQYQRYPSDLQPKD